MNDVSEEIVSIKADVDVVVARQRARGLLSGWRFSGSELTLIATAISEVARNIVSYAGNGEIVLRDCAPRATAGITGDRSRPGSRDCRHRTRHGGRLLDVSRARFGLTGLQAIDG